MKVLEKKSEEMGSGGSDPFSTATGGLGPNSSMKDLRDHIQSCLKFVELVQLLGSSMVQGVGERAGTEVQSLRLQGHDLILACLVLLPIK